MTDTNFTAEERAAMKERAKEVRSARRGAKAGDGEAEILAKIAEMAEPDRAIAERIHALVKENAPGLTFRLWYGMPAYAGKGGKVVCFLQPAGKFKARYATLGFNDDAQLDEGTVWPTAYAITRLTADDEARLAEVIRKAAG
ncbi:DUF1801 domain-containing protein [Actinoplanes sp. NPDC051861]|uniref:iron chaperone n=1 Tax=Actinoplanes sp. NPDC051861 TaxID=3155170 RepID=UPI00343C9BBE